MSLTYSLRGPRDLYEKLKRDGYALDREVKGDAMFNFVITAYHLQEWIRNNRSAPPAAIAEARTMLLTDPLIKVCRDIANASKHFSLNKPPTTVSSVQSEQGFGIGRFGHGGFGVGEERITLTLSDGASLDVLTWKDDVLALYGDFFQRHDL